ncbi:MAG: peptidyl-prolyl cis-trans isomerase [Alphaproteobacteria bacterium]|nr:peptidyl-prolyl cis-trans isomerase [Alphaproteobacteria bacterium]
MINKFAKMHNSVFTKIILTVTALSFMSLFGVSGYITSANSNKTVVKVDDLEMTQSEFNYFLQRKLLEFKNMSGIDLEEHAEQKSQITDALLKAKVDEMILENTMKKYNVDFPTSLVREIILVTPQFSVNGQFSREQFNWYLRQGGVEEKEYIKNLKLNLARSVLLDSQVSYANVPEIAQQMMAKVVGQRRTFKYVKVENKNVKVTRSPSKDELDQYYDDMKEELMIPEKRDLTVLYLAQNDLANKIEVTPEEIAAYYKEHIDEFEQPAQRHVLQMVFENEEKANVAYAKLQEGADFMTEAKEAGQTEADTDLGFVGKDDLADELSEIIFALPLNKISEVQKVADSWQILKVIEAKEAIKMPKTQAEAKIINEIRQDKAYDNSYEVVSEIEDKLGAGADLAAIAESYGVSLYNVKGVSEDGRYDSADDTLSEILKNKDVIDTAFSYNEGETGQAVETDDGIAVVKVDGIIESHEQPRDEAEAKLREFWLENERASIVQELVDNIQHDVDAGDDLTSVAHRYNLSVKNTMPVTRDEKIDVLTTDDMRTLFAALKDEPQIIKSGDDYVIAVTSDIFDDSASLSDADKKMILQTLYNENVREMTEALLQDFAKDYKIEVNQHRVGLNEE